MLDNYIIIHKSVLPDYYEKVIEVRRLVESGKAADVSRAVKQIGISRSTYYKYKDYVYKPSELSEARKAVISVMLKHRPGILSALLSVISDAKANVFTITQSPPIHDAASVTITLDITAMTDTVNTLLNKISKISGVENSRLLAIE